MATLYYDPILDVHHRLPVASALTTSYYAAPQCPDDARRLFDAGCISMGLNREPDLPLRAGRAYGSSLVLAREWGLTELEDRLVSAIEASFEPTWDTELGEFTWGMGLNEPHPRGQYNAFLAAAEAAGPGMWTGLSAAPLESCPQLVDVDFPDMAFSRAEWVGDTLHVSLAPRVENPRRTTTFRIVGSEPRMWYLTGLDGVTMDTAGSATLVRVPMVKADLEFGAGSY
ncbi:MAG: hypothetical protein GY713_20560 [Actinomycetia bacterium]|nr:hypothetical protein [Actinomycetes bacterium]MCP3913328.1 hypothetical protein [Actinomycetes bacterium]